MARKFKEVPKADFIILGKDEDNEGKAMTPVLAVEGTLQSKEQMNMRGTLVGRYGFITDEEKVFTLLGAKQLDDMMVGIQTGTYLKITLEKETTRTAQGNEMKNFKVEIGE